MHHCIEAFLYNMQVLIFYQNRLAPANPRSNSLDYPKEPTALIEGLCGE